MIKIDLRPQIERKSEEARMEYNKLAFMLNCIIPMIDKLSETKLYQKQVKYHANQLLKLIEPICNEHQNAYINYGRVQNEGGTIHTQDVFNVTDDAYNEALEFFTESLPSDVVKTMYRIKELKESNSDFLDVAIPYRPIQD